MPTKKPAKKKIEEKPDKPPRGYEYKTFLVKKEKKDAKMVRKQDNKGIREKRQNTQAS